ncbi:PDZ domain-containing protein [Aliidongia dinghuensis]|uniref:hypothetical protein n=1 Tax=Aliidongia dinghuensis TaxID=1867774 RepID=UPI001669F531|nr:hypothetical protein [Aliidongia dinghuensis]
MRLAVAFGCLASVAFGSVASASITRPRAVWPDGLRIAPQRVEAVRALAEGLTRNDGEAIHAGWQGRKGWSKAVRRAEKAAGTVRDPQAFGLVLRTLYASYPSLHSHMDLRADIDLRASYGAPYLPFTIKVSILGPGVIPNAVFISSAANDEDGLSGARPAVGDRVTAMNGRPISYWLSQTATACRRNSRWQCYDDFDKQLRSGLLGWDPRRSLSLDISRDGTRQRSTYTPRAVPTRSDQHARTGCGEDDTNYRGFTSVYAGWNLCVFRSATGPGVEVWRLKSFHYAANAAVDSPKSEVDRFWTQYWKAAAPSVRTLVVDVSGNGGGDVPLPWYSLLFDNPYQEQYAEYRRLRAYDDPAVASEVADDPSHERWIARVRAEAWHTIGGYLPPVPMFCTDDDENCEGKLATPKPNGFTGVVALVLDDNCISSCAGFSWNILTKLGPRAAAYGLPDSGDSNFARLPLKLFYRGGKWNTAIGAGSIPNEKPIAIANVMVTRTTESDGRVISGKSLPVRVTVKRRWNDTANSWAERALHAALGMDGKIARSIKVPEEGN